MDLQHIAFIIGKRDASVWQDYLDKVAYDGLMRYQAIRQWGGKAGESLYTHVWNGVQVLETLREPLSLTDQEARLLYTAFTLHDINKAVDRPDPFGKLATKENLAQELERLGLAAFFPDWAEYANDLESLVRGHSGHHHSGGERWVIKAAPRYRLGEDRVNQLLHLMRAADVIDLSHTLNERDQKAAFLGHLNAYLADAGANRQYQFFTHRLTEQRGILSNVIHNAIAEELRQAFGLIPLLFYPDGIAYLASKDLMTDVTPAMRERIAARIAGTISDFTASKFRDFISPAPSGIKVDAKCLDLGVPFSKILREIHGIIQRREPEPTAFDEKVRDWGQREFETHAAEYPEMAKNVQMAIESSALLVSPDPSRLRDAELIRAYYSFLNKHFADVVEDAWGRIYALLELPEERHNYYAFFNALWARAYAISADLVLSEEEIYRRLEGDGAALLSEQDSVQDPKVALFTDYVARYVVFPHQVSEGAAFQDHLVHYVENQHQQCVYCSGPFPTAKWMAPDVRSDITVQTFSNRLRGGPGEPKKHVCAICHLQFLLEKLNYQDVRGENLVYLHLYPYSFHTGEFIKGIKAAIGRVVSEDAAVQALNLNLAEGMQSYLEDGIAKPTFRSRTQKDRPQPFGLYLPRYAETIGNLLIFPINPAGQNDTEQFLFALWNAMLLQRYFGVKVLVSDLAVPPLGKDDMPDLYVDNVPLACQGLLPRNDYAEFVGETSEPGDLPKLWEDVGHLFSLRRLTFSTEDNTARLVRALGAGPLNIFFETDRLLEKRLRGESGGLSTWLPQQAFPHVKALAISRGGRFMKELGVQLQRAATLAWEGGLRGRSLERSSLLYPASEVLTKLSHGSSHVDRGALRAAAVQDIFDHLSRIADDQYRPGRKKWEAVTAFVDIWFDDILDGVYGGSLRKLLADDKVLRSAFLFYVRDAIPSRKAQD